LLPSGPLLAGKPCEKIVRRSLLPVALVLLRNLKCYFHLCREIAAFRGKCRLLCKLGAQNVLTSCASPWIFFASYLLLSRGSSAKRLLHVRTEQIGENPEQEDSHRGVEDQADDVSEDERCEPHAKGMRELQAREHDRHPSRPISEPQQADAVYEKDRRDGQRKNDHETEWGIQRIPEDVCDYRVRSRSINADANVQPHMPEKDWDRGDQAENYERHEQAEDGDHCDTDRSRHRWISTGGACVHDAGHLITIFPQTSW
jgi:hypothetical protein